MAGPVPSRKKNFSYVEIRSRQPPLLVRCLSGSAAQEAMNFVQQHL